jgi:hypothetical protein
MRQPGVVENEKVLKTLTRASGGRREQRLTWLIEEHAVAMTRQMLSQYELTFDLAVKAGPGYQPGASPPSVLRRVYEMV